MPARAPSPRRKPAPSAPSTNVSTQAKNKRTMPEYPDTAAEAAPTAPISYATSIRPLFRDKDRNSMLNRFDLFKYEDVKVWAQRIYDQLSSQNMPCDNPWDDTKVA